MSRDAEWHESRPDRLNLLLDGLGRVWREKETKKSAAQAEMLLKALQREVAEMKKAQE